VSPPILVAKRLTAGYGKIDILHEVSLDVRLGEIVSIIGPNGAGKSTAFQTIVGVLPSRPGRVVFGDADITGLSPDFRPPTRPGLRAAGPHRIPPDDRARETGKQKAGTMSGGEQQMLAIGHPIMTTPKLIMLDEPSLGLSPKFVTLIFGKLGEMEWEGDTLMIVEQNAARALALADRAYVLELGRNRFEGPGRELLLDPEVKRL
jgi:ABC-type branched-subunit amino acid transport system ATPase component